MHALLVLNSRSRRGIRDGDAVCRALEDAGVQCERNADAGPFDAVIAAGGDGTIVRTVPLALERDLPMGIVPLGTFNDLARSLDIPLDVHEACEVIANGSERRIDVGRVNGVHFVNEASIGISTRIARRQTPDVKQRFGFLGVAMTTLQSLRETRPFFAHVRYGGRSERLRTLQITIANNARFGGVIERPDASLDDGWLDLYSVEVRSWTQAVPLAGKILRRDASPGQGLRTRRAPVFQVQTHRPHHVTADGEPAGMTPATFEVLPRALRVLVPNPKGVSS
ncbi:MAG TPA: YegS/Rv2252/BmrU family lipid kinase [Candidatus Baltobacteraceae bacterium]|nr:YegS/Rv2252/BmrU family lipid kinase [Candidatus Baltobacteraceae bacterium]